MHAQGRPQLLVLLLCSGPLVTSTIGRTNTTDAEVKVERRTMWTDTNNRLGNLMRNLSWAECGYHTRYPDRETSVYSIELVWYSDNGRDMTGECCDSHDRDECTGYERCEPVFTICVGAVDGADPCEYFKSPRSVKWWYDNNLVGRMMFGDTIANPLGRMPNPYPVCTPYEIGQYPYALTIKVEDNDSDIVPFYDMIAVFKRPITVREVARWGFETYNNVDYFVENAAYRGWNVEETLQAVQGNATLRIKINQESIPNFYPNVEHGVYRGVSPHHVGGEPSSTPSTFERIVEAILGIDIN